MKTPALLTTAVFVSLLLLLAGCSSLDEHGGSSAAKGTFPVPPEIQDNVAFWRHVFAEWSRGKVAIHDDEHLGVIYEVATLPGPTLASYTPEQKRFVRGRKELYRARLERLETDVRAGKSPRGSTKELYQKLVKAGGRQAVYGAAERVRSQRGLRERFHRGLEISGRYDAAFRNIFRGKGLPEDLAYLPHVESSFQAHARSSAGAAGMWQFTRGTGKIYLTVNGAIDERLDPVIAAEGAARYLRDAYRKLESWPLAVTSYNHGQAGMMRAKGIYGDDIGKIVRYYKGPRFRFASRNFYPEFVAAREVASNPNAYFPEGVRYHRPLSEERLVLPRRMAASHLARSYGLSPYRLADLNLHWMEPARRGQAELPPGSTVWLPAGTLGGIAKASSPWPGVVAKAEPEATGRPYAGTSTKTKIQTKTAERVSSNGEKTKVAAAVSNESISSVDASVPEIETSKAARRDPAGSPTMAVAAALPEAKQVSVAAVKADAAPAEARAAAMPVSAKVHVVKPNETLYRVGIYYDLSVDELRRLNRMDPEDTDIKPGQRLRVSG